MHDEELAALERYNIKLIISKLINGIVVEPNAPTLAGPDFHRKLLGRQ